jgi:hypothetical protein
MVRLQLWTGKQNVLAVMLVQSRSGNRGSLYARLLPAESYAGQAVQKHGHQQQGTHSEKEREILQKAADHSA